jgi:aryl-alcohol dehydrogenase-like predicted oxidoreductase
MHYSLLIRDIERDLVPMSQRYGLGLTVWSPLVSGFLSGKYTRENLTDKEFGFRLVDRLRAIATNHGASVAQVAIAWLLAKKAVTSVPEGTEGYDRGRTRNEVLTKVSGRRSHNSWRITSPPRVWCLLRERSPNWMS